MKRILLIAGLILMGLAIASLVTYLFDYEKLSNYGKGYVWGKIIILILGGFLIFLSRKPLRKSK
jgi:uncharacterized membrane protein YraQ (UPF0718 family)